MNIFGNFTFGKSIKTLIPGFVILSGLCLLIDSIAFLFQPDYKPLSLLKSLSSIFIEQPVFSGLIILSASIILGIFSNIVFYTYLNDKFIRRAFKKKHPEFEAIENDFKEALTEVFLSKNHLTQQTYFSKMERHLHNVDDLYFLMPILPLDKYNFLLESYWYYLEFIQNICMATAFWVLSLYIYIISFGIKFGVSPSLILLFTALTILIIPVFRMLKKAALKNFKSHQFKLLSLKIGAIHFENKKK